MDQDNIAMELKENETDEAVKNEEKFAFYDGDSNEEEEWKEQEEGGTIGKGEIKVRQVMKEREKQLKMLEEKRNT